MDTPFSDVQRRMVSLKSLYHFVFALPSRKAAGSAKVSFLSMELETLSRTKNDNMNEQERLKASALQFYAGWSISLNIPHLELIQFHRGFGDGRSATWAIVVPPQLSLAS